MGAVISSYHIQAITHPETKQKRQVFVQNYHQSVKCIYI